MKNILLIALASLALQACEPRTQEEWDAIQAQQDKISLSQRTDQASRMKSGDAAWLWIDPETGCQYISKYSSSSSWTPRIARDGVSHYGCGS